MELVFSKYYTDTLKDNIRLVDGSLQAFINGKVYLVKINKKGLYNYYLIKEEQQWNTK